MDKHTVIIVVLSTLLTIDQALAAIPSIKANSVYQLVTNCLEAIVYFVKQK